MSNAYGSVSQTPSPIASSTLGNSLADLLLCADISPGDDVSYNICKIISLYHPLGQKIAETPVKMAQFLPRKITIAEGPEEDLVKAFNKQRQKDGIDATICNTAKQARIYGISSLALLQKDVPPAEPLELAKLADTPIAFNVLDPLNTAGSLVLNQDPNSMDFQKHKDISVNGVRYHRSRTITVMNEFPIYIWFNPAAFGFVGPSVYQRALFPLKSYINTMIANDMVARKAGLIVAKLKMAGSVIDMVMQMAANIKRTILQLGATNNVLSISTEEDIMSVDLTNIDGPLTTARKHILEDIASATPMPAKLLNNETFAEGFGEGSEDAQHVRDYIDNIRNWITPLYDFTDLVTQRRAWNKKFYEGIQEKYPETYGKRDYEEVFYEWSNSFEAEWPPLLREPESEQVRVADTKMKAVIAFIQVFFPEMSPAAKIETVKWAEEQINNTKELFSSQLALDLDELLDFFEENKEAMMQAAAGEDKAPKAPPPFSARDSAAGGIAAYLGNADPGDGSVSKRISRIEDHIRKAVR